VSPALASPERGGGGDRGGRPGQGVPPGPPAVVGTERKHSGGRKELQGEVGLSLLASRNRFRTRVDDVGSTNMADRSGRKALTSAAISLAGCQVCDVAGRERPWRGCVDPIPSVLYSSRLDAAARRHVCWAWVLSLSSTHR